MKKEMLINVLQPEECRIAILEDGTLEELYVERTNQESYVGNIYKGKIVNIEPSIQAAFIDFGVGRNGFLHVSDVDPAYYKHLTPGGRREGGGRGGRRDERPRHQAPRDDFEPDFERRPPMPARQSPPADDFDAELPPPIPREEERRPPRQREDDRRPPQPRQRDDRGRGRGPSRPPMEYAPPDEEIELAPVDDADPYAALASEVGEVAPTVYESSDTEEPVAGEEPAGEEAPRRGGRRRGRGRGRGRTEDAPTEDAAPEPVAHRELPPPLPPRPSGPVIQRLAPEVKKPEPKAVEPAFDDFGAGLDLWGDSPPPPYMPGTERRTDDDDDEFESDQRGGGDYNRDDDDEDEDDDEIGDEPAADGEPRRPRRDGRRPGGGGGRRGGRDGDGVPKPLIQDIFKRGQEVLVQVIKEGIGTKGPTLSTYISIAGRYLVLMPGLSRIGVSRKIPDDEQRRRLKDILTDLRPPQGVGFIIRTAGMDRNKKELQNDLAYLLRIWQVIVKRVKSTKGPSALYQESDMITRTIRDTFTGDVDAIWIDEPQAYQHALEFLQGVMPRYASRLKLFDSVEPLFHKYNIDADIAKIQQKKLPLPNGGSIVIEQTEALVAIDVNSGNFRMDNNSEETAYHINMQAAKEIARQLRLRDLGGVIVNDFIDMRDEKHRRAVEKGFRDALKRDRARTKMLRISQFGLIEMTRQRIRPSLKRSIFQDCQHCNAVGHVKTVESMAIESMRVVQLAAFRDQVKRIDVRVHANVAEYLVNRRRREISSLEDRGNITVSVTSLRDVSPEKLEFTCFDAQNNEVPLNPADYQGGGGNRNPQRRK